MTTMKAVLTKTVLTSLVVAAFTTSALAESYSETFLVPEGTITIEQVGEGKLPPSTRGRLFAVENDCTKQSRTGVPLANNDGGVVFDDGLSGTLVTGNPELDIILNLGKQAWKLVQDNAPVVSTKLATANALPQGIQCWNQLEKWQAVRSVDYKISYKTVAGYDAISYVARVVYAYGGSYKGKGRYIANAAVQNKEVMVKWTNSFDVSVEIPQVLNGGSSENPVAVMQINLNMEARNKLLPLKHFGHSVSFMIYGDGRPLQFIQ